jgi:hypothetical protein
MKIIISSLSYKNHASLTVYAHTEKNEFSLHRMPVTEIHGDTRKKIALALLSNYPHKLILWGALAAEFDAPEGVCRVLDQLQNLKKPIREKEIMEVLQNPTLENVERFVALRKLLE